MLKMYKYSTPIIHFNSLLQNSVKRYFAKTICFCWGFFSFLFFPFYTISDFADSTCLVQIDELPMMNRNSIALFHHDVATNGIKESTVIIPFAGTKIKPIQTSLISSCWTIGPNNVAGKLWNVTCKPSLWLCRILTLTYSETKFNINSLLSLLIYIAFAFSWKHNLFSGSF